MPTEPAVPILTQELAHRLEAAAVVFGRAWLGGIPGLTLGDFGPRLLVGCHPERPELDFQNRVNGLSREDARLIPDIGRFYDERGVRPWWEIVPDHDWTPIAEALVARGAAQIGFHAVAFGAPAPDDAPGPAEVVEVEDAESFAVYARVRMEAHDLPPAVREEAAADLRGWFGAPGTRLYLATRGGEPVATAALTVHAGVGYLADAATSPVHRGAGIQGQLIRTRIAAAADAGCDVVCSQATFGSASHRNLQRHGLTGGFTKVLWR